MFIHWRSIMASDNVYRPHPSRKVAMTKTSFDFRAALLVAVGMTAPLTWAHDERPATPEHVTGETIRIDAGLHLGPNPIRR